VYEERAGKHVESHRRRIAYALQYTYIRAENVYMTASVVKATHTRVAGNSHFPLYPSQAHPFARPILVSNRLSYTGFHTQTHRHAVSYSILCLRRGISFLCLSTYAHTHMRFRNLFRSLYIHIIYTRTHNVLSPHFLLPQTLLRRRLQIYVYVYALSFTPVCMNERRRRLRRYI